ncbi:MAG: ATP-binding cassette domain-containing protein, partial [Candidatus Thorarchaeota archaeon]
MTESNPILQVRNVKKWFPVRTALLSFLEEKRYVKAVDGVSFDLVEGGSLVIAGESGCGTTTLVRTILRLLEPTAG